MASNFDPERKFVRVIATRANGFVDFEFSVGEPGMAAELVLPRAAFAEFCAANRVIFLAGDKPREGGDAAADDEWNWNLRQATQQRFR